MNIVRLALGDGLRICVVGSLLLIMPGLQVGSKLPTRSQPTKSQLRLALDIQKAGGHFDQESGGNPLKFQTVFLPKNALNQIHPTALAVFPQLRALMIIEKRDQQEHPLTGCLVDGADDLLALEFAYRDARWIQ